MSAWERLCSAVEMCRALAAGAAAVFVFVLVVAAGAGALVAAVTWAVMDDWL